MERLKKFYFGLPEFLRWILFLPLSFIGAIIVRLFLYSVAYREGVLSVIANMGSSIAGAIVFLYVVSYLIPRFKRNALIIFIGIRTLVLIALIILVGLTFFLTITQAHLTVTEEVLLRFGDSVSMIIQEAIIFIVSLKLLKEVAPKPINIDSVENV